MKIFILTSSNNGSAAYILPFLLSSEKIRISDVILINNISSSKYLSYKRRLRKISKIGILGAINGLRMRKWYKENVYNLLKPSDLRTICSKNDLSLKEINATSYRDAEEIIKSLNADLGISLENTYIPESIFSIPSFGMINVHHELLPEYQNAQSIIWQIYNGSNKTGFTIHKINKNIDEGDILYQKSIDLEFKKNLNSTVTHNYAALLEHSAQGLLSLLENYQYYDAKSYSQSSGNKYTTPSIKQMFKIYENFYKLKKQKTIYR